MCPVCDNTLANSVSLVFDGRWQIMPITGHTVVGTLMIKVPFSRGEPARPRVGIFVENDVLRHGLEAVLRLLPHVSEVRYCGTGDEAVSLLASGETDLLIVTGRETGWLNAATPSIVKVLMLLDEAETRDPAFVAPPSVHGFLIQQELSVDALTDALDRIVAGEMPMPARLGRELLARAGSAALPERPRPLSLTSRENETLILLAEGLSNKQIARRLGISDHGAKRLVTSILLKLGAPNRTTAVVTAIKAGMVDYGAGSSTAARTVPNSGLAR